MSRRVVVTGTGVLSPVGNDRRSMHEALLAGHCGIVAMPQWNAITALRCRLGAPVDFDGSAVLKRRALRSMGRTAQLGVHATALAIADARLEGDALRDGRTGIAYGSATGSPDALLEFVQTVANNDASTLKATSYLRAMSHTAAVNMGVHFGVTGRIYTTSSACTAASQALGFAFEAIRSGAQDRMLAGGCDELTAAHCAVFDALLATSASNDTPQQALRPFDAQRTGLVLGEGAGTLVLEALETAQRRGAPILAEIIGFATNSDGVHLTAPNEATQAEALAAALRDADITAEAIGYVSAHGTGTATGDVSESRATAAVLGSVPISSIKGHMGHTLGACGALEAVATIEMMREGTFAATRNLAQVEPECAELDYLSGGPRALDVCYAMTNNFAFGGINTAIVLKRWDD
ncbi:MAG: beta-ketoacyl-ACP synthase [Pseudomonadota bacterium]